MSIVNLEFVDGIPDVKPGHMLPCIILTEYRGKNASFAAYYLNAFPLERDECICQDDHDDGCPTTGWFYDESNFEYDNCYHAVSATVLAWAPIPSAADILAALVLKTALRNQGD